MKIIYINGCIYTGNGQFETAFAVENDRFCWVGSDISSMAAPDDQIVDLQGHFVCAGFNDSHMHLLSYGQALSRARLDQHTGSLSDMLRCLRDFLANRTGDGWLIGRGWNQDYYTDVHRMPNRYDLDQVSTEVPICAVRTCGHALCLNSKALSLLGITAETPAPEGGEIGVMDGAPDGLLYDAAMDLVYDNLPAPELEDVKNMLRRACKEVNAVGITNYAV